MRSRAVAPAAAAPGHRRYQFGQDRDNQPKTEHIDQQRDEDKGQPRASLLSHIRLYSAPDIRFLRKFAGHLPVGGYTFGRRQGAR